ncbi:MAG TPA: methylated-DNA--[protein]-cysteine S-methyltransferase [Mycobacteriales bacterium]|nr:methylated-DNA--[protein]-cysteine S-methyltransferase [Mycobacteriales bacterium]
MTEGHGGDLFATLPRRDEDAHRRLHARLAAAAAEAGILDVAYRTVDSPIGHLLVAATGDGLVRVAFAVEDHERVLDRLGRTVSPRVLRAPARLDAVARQLEEYFARRRTRFDLPLDLRLATGFRREVLTRLPAIPYGTTASYATLAAAAGNPRAVRAVGTACATNPLPVVVPCHRVVRSDGTIGGYLGGVAAKWALLALEGAADPGGPARSSDQPANNSSNPPMV